MAHPPAQRCSTPHHVCIPGQGATQHYPILTVPLSRKKFTMSDKKIIAVVGSTGAQGGGLVRAIIKDGVFAARALTRDPSKANAEVCLL